MFSTPASLLDRLRKSEEATAWDRFVELYTPLLFHWAKRLGLQNSDSADLVQDVFLLLWRKVPEFDYDPNKSFHAWLKTIFLNQHRSRQRGRVPVPVDAPWHELAEESSDELDDPDYRDYLIRQAFRLIENEFTSQQQQVFREYALKGRSPDDVARDLNIRPGAVYCIKSRILMRLRQELRHLLD